ncbi:MAG: hypothetical protein VZS44_10650 [Bacilli bacterium]|nr:hypothetical protein [Bacilli bacterium]
MNELREFKFHACYIGWKNKELLQFTTSEEEQEWSDYIYNKLCETENNICEIDTVNGTTKAHILRLDDTLVELDIYFKITGDIKTFLSKDSHIIIKGICMEFNEIFRSISDFNIPTTRHIYKDGEYYIPLSDAHSYQSETLQLNKDNNDDFPELLDRLYSSLVQDMYKI